MVEEKKKDSEDLDLCLDTVYLICPISLPWKSKDGAVFGMSMPCITAIVTLTYPASGLQGLFRIPCTRRNRWFPEISSGILDFPGRWNYLWPICQFFTVCLRGAENGRFWHLSASADTCSADQEKLHMLIWRDCFAAIYYHSFEWVRVRSKTGLLAPETNLKAVLLPAVALAAQICRLVSEIMLIGIIMHEMRF